MNTHHFLVSCCSLMLACGEPLTLVPSRQIAEVGDIITISPPPPLAACRAGIAALTGGNSYTTIVQAAAAMGGSGALWLCPGIYDTTIPLPGQGPYLISGITGDPADVVIEGSGGSPDAAITFPSRYNVLLRMSDITFDGRHSGQFGEFILAVENGSSVEIEDIIVRNMMTRPGFIDYGLVMSNIRRFTARRVLFENNTSIHQITVSGGGVSGPAQVLIEDLTCRGTRAGSQCLHLSATSAFGVYNGLTATVRRAIMTDNEVVGPVVAMGGGNWTLDIEDSSFERNTIGDLVSNGDGGVLEVDVDDLRYTDPNGRLMIERSSFLDNLTADNGSAVTLDNGLADHEWEITADISDSEFLRNTTLDMSDPSTISLPAYGAVRLTNVDLGTGADNNVPVDIHWDCAGVDYGAGTNLLVRHSFRTGNTCR